MKLFDRLLRVFKPSYDRSAMREPLFLEMLKQGLGAGPVTMIDVGSNDGVEAIFALRLGIPGLCVHLIEPDAENLQQCRRNIRRAVGDNAAVTYSNHAISNMDGDGVFYRNAHASHLNSASRTECATIEVPVNYLTLESYLQRHRIEGPMLIKMDIEGHEVEVLEHFSKYAATHSSIAVLMEVHPSTYNDEHSLERVLRGYLENGFRPVLIESAGVQQPEAFRQRGMNPIKTCGRRGLYRDMDPDFFLLAACHEKSGGTDMPDSGGRKLVRSLLLQKP